VAAAEAYMRGIERRITAGLNPDVGSVASLFVSRWDITIVGKEPEWLRNQFGIAVAWQTHERYRHLLDLPRSDASSMPAVEPSDFSGPALVPRIRMPPTLSMSVPWLHPSP
jgi:hypothetical protein